MVNLNIQVKITSKENIHGRNIKVSIPHIKQDVPLYVVFKAMNVTNDFDITNYILYDVPRDNWREYTQFLRASLGSVKLPAPAPPPTSANI